MKYKDGDASRRRPCGGCASREGYSYARDVERETCRGIHAGGGGAKREGVREKWEPTCGYDPTEASPAVAEGGAGASGAVEGSEVT